MQYKVPQNVDIEDKVIGSLTIRQFVILLVAVGIILVLNFIFIGPLRIIFYLLAFIIGGIAVTVAFLKYGDQNFEIFLLSAWKTFVSPRKRIWKKEPIQKPRAKDQGPIKKQGEPKPVPKQNIEDARDNLSRLAEIVDSGGYAETKDLGRTSNITHKVENQIIPDILAEASKENYKIDPIIEAAGRNVPKREKLVSEAASLPPTQPQETPKIKLRGDGFN